MAAGDDWAAHQLIFDWVIIFFWWFLTVDVTGIARKKWNGTERTAQLPVKPRKILGIFEGSVKYPWKINQESLKYLKDPSSSLKIHQKSSKNPSNLEKISWESLKSLKDPPRIP